jgi:hypothetical protein
MFAPSAFTQGPLLDIQKFFLVHKKDALEQKLMLEGLI